MSCSDETSEGTYLDIMALRKSISLLKTNLNEKLDNLMKSQNDVLKKINGFVLAQGLVLENIQSDQKELKQMFKLHCKDIGELNAIVHEGNDHCSSTEKYYSGLSSSQVQEMISRPIPMIKQSVKKNEVKISKNVDSSSVEYTPPASPVNQSVNDEGNIGNAEIPQSSSNSLPKNISCPSKSIEEQVCDKAISSHLKNVEFENGPIIPAIASPSPNDALKLLEDTTSNKKVNVEEITFKENVVPVDHSTPCGSPVKSFASFMAIKNTKDEFGNSFLVAKQENSIHNETVSESRISTSKQLQNENNKTTELDENNSLILLPAEKNVLNLEAGTETKVQETLFENECKLYTLEFQTKKHDEIGMTDVTIIYDSMKKCYIVNFKKQCDGTICGDFVIDESVYLNDNKSTKNCGILKCKDTSEGHAVPTIFVVRFRKGNVYDEFQRIFNLAIDEAKTLSIKFKRAFADPKNL